MTAPTIKAKAAKPPVFRGVIGRFPRAMVELARVSQFGCGKHRVPIGDMGYLDIPDAGGTYADAEARHMVYREIEGSVNTDPSDGNMLHLAQKAWNALAALEYFLRELERRGDWSHRCELPPDK